MGVEVWGRGLTLGTSQLTQRVAGVGPLSDMCADSAGLENRLWQCYMVWAFKQLKYY